MRIDRKVYEDGNVRGDVMVAKDNHGNTFLATITVGEEVLQLYDPADLLSLASVASEMALPLEVNDAVLPA